MSDGIGGPQERLEVAGVLAVALAGVLFIAHRTAPGWWFGCGCLAAAGVYAHARFGGRLVAALDRLRAPRRIFGREVVPSAVLPELLAILAVAGVATGMLGVRVLLGDRPVNQDHTTQFTQMWETKELLLSHGRILGWSNTWFAGHPVGYQYPVGAGLFVTAVYVLGLGMLSFAKAYAIGFWLFFVLGGVAVYRLGASTFGRAAGLVAAFFFLVDGGGGRTGGWEWGVDVGVWPNAFSVVLAVFAVARLGRVVERGAWSDVAVFALLVAASNVTHPMQLLFFALVCVLASAVACFVLPRAEAGRAVLRIVTGHAVGMLLTMSWFLPFTTSSAFATKHGIWWLPAFDIGTQLMDGTLLDGTLPWVTVSGLFGAVAGLRLRRFLPLFCSVLSLVLIGTFASSFVDELHATSLFGSLAYVQYVRGVIALRPFWFVLAAFAMLEALGVARSVVAAPGAARGGAGDERPFGRAAVALLLCTMLAPVAFGVVTESVETFFSRRVSLASDRPAQEARREMARVIRGLPGGFYRIGWSFRKGGNEMMDLATETGRPMFKLRGGTPTSTFIYKLVTEDPAALAASRVRYLLVDKKLKGDRYRLVHEKSPLYLYELTDFDPTPVDVLDGAAKVEVPTFEAEHVVVRAPAGASGRLRLPVSNFSRWRATRDGVPVPITATQVSSLAKSGFITVPLAPGTYRFDFAPTAADRTAVGCFVLGALAVAALLLVGRKNRFATRVAGWLTAADARAERLAVHRLAAPLVAAATVFALAGAAAAASWTPPAREEGGARARYDFLESLPFATVRSGDRKCRRWFDRFTCAGGPWGHVASRPTVLETFSTRRCISAGPFREHDVVVSFPDVPPGGTILGHYGLAKGGGSARFSISVGGKRVLDAAPAAVGKTKTFAIPFSTAPRNVEFLVTSEDVRPAHFCFYAQIVDGADAKASGKSAAPAPSSSEDAEEAD